MEGMGSASPWMALGGAGLGLIKGYTLDKDKEKRQRELAAKTALYSPWTGMQPQQVQEADPWGNAMQGGFSGLAQGQAFQKAQNEDDLNRAKMYALYTGKGTVSL